MSINLRNIEPVEGQPGVFKTSDGTLIEQVRVFQKKDEPPPPAAPAAAARPPPAAPSEPVKPEPDAWTAARSRVEAAVTPLVPETAPTKEELAGMDPYRQALNRLARPGLYGDSK